MRLSDLMHYVMIALEDAGLTRQRDFYLTFRHITRGLHYVEMYFVVADQRIGFTYQFSILRLKAARYPVVLSEIIELIVQSVAKAHDVPGSIDWLKTDEINEAVRSLPTRLLGKIPDDVVPLTPSEVIADTLDPIDNSLSRPGTVGEKETP